MLKAAAKAEVEGTLLHIDSAAVSMGTQRTWWNLTVAGLAAWVEFRVGDALETLRADLPGVIDLVFLDGPKNMYLDVLKLVEARVRPGGIVASDNTDHDGLEPFLEYLRTPGNGYTSAAILTAGGRGPRGHEIAIRH